MASILKVDNLTGNTTAKNVTVTVGASATQSLEQGLAKVYSNYDQSSGDGTLNKSLNISSPVDDGLGKQGLNFTSSMSDAVYSVSGFNEDGVGENDSIGMHRDTGQTKSSSQFFYLCMSGTSKNEGLSSIQIFGDLA